MQELSYEFKGYIQVSRTIFFDPLLAERRKFSRQEAYIDLLQSARYSSESTTEMLGGKMITWATGEVPASARYLAARWGWGKDSVKRFLDALIAKNWIALRLESGQTILSIATGQQTRQQQGQQQGQQDEPPQRNPSDSSDSKRDSKSDTDKDKIEESKKKRIRDSALSQGWKKWSEAEFKNDVGRFAGQFSDPMRDKFFSYWSEPSPMGRMRFQLERTWETKRRLNTWRDRDRTYRPNELPQQKLHVV